VDNGYVYVQSGEISKAKTEYEKAIKQLGNYYPQTVIDLANAFLFRNEVDYALDTYKQGRKLFKTYPYNYYLADIYKKKQDYPAMMSEFADLLNVNSSYLIEIQNRLQVEIMEEDADNSKKEALKAVLLKRIQENPEKTSYSQLLYWYSIQLKDFEIAFIQAKSLDKRMNLQGEMVYNLAILASSNGNYDIAAKSYEFIISKGMDSYYYYNSRIALLNVLFLKITANKTFSQQDIIDLENKYLLTIEELGKTSTTLPLLKNLAHIKAFYLNKSDEAIEILKEIMEIKNTSPLTIAECKVELADILLFTEDVWEATLLYSQVEKAFKNEPIGFEAKLKNAKLYYYIGEFNWAKAQLDVLKASTSKLISNDAIDLSLLISDNIDYDSSTVPLSMYAKADLLSFRNLDKEALLILDSIKMLFPDHPLADEVLYKKAQIFLKIGQYSEADTLLKQLIKDYSYGILADKALYQLAGLYETCFKNNGQAMIFYQQLITDYPGSIFTVEARKRYRILRGENIN
jgi:tetratricopeptide (TPR) repeat protein